MESSEKSSGHSFGLGVGNDETCSDYTYEEFVQEFQAEVAPEAVFEEDARVEAEHEVLDGGTYQVGRVPDKQYLTVIITLTAIKLIRYILITAQSKNAG